jgi:ATP-binding cassette subfamily F protein 3
MFSGDDVFKKLGVLSGGERNRYAMAKMLVSPSNMLLLDEPTNHLDLRAKDVLLDAIRNFTGTVLFVSHDRYFIDGLATRVFEVEDRRLHIYPGNYEDYLWRKQGGPEKVTEQITNSLIAGENAGTGKSAGASFIDSDVWASSEGRPSSTEPAAEPTPAVPIKRLNPIKLKQLEDRLQHAEQEISRLESAITNAEERLGNFTSAEQSQKDAAELETLRTRRTATLSEWEELSLTLEEQQLA